jgi:hypothetical protein
MPFAGSAAGTHAPRPVVPAGTGPAHAPATPAAAPQATPAAPPATEPPKP